MDWSDELKKKNLRSSHRKKAKSRRILSLRFRKRPLALTTTRRFYSRSHLHFTLRHVHLRFDVTCDGSSSRARGRQNTVISCFSKQCEETLTSIAVKIDSLPVRRYEQGFDKIRRQCNNLRSANRADAHFDACRERFFEMDSRKSSKKSNQWNGPPPNALNALNGGATELLAGAIFRLCNTLTRRHTSIRALVQVLPRHR